MRRSAMAEALLLQWLFKGLTRCKLRHLFQVTLYFSWQCQLAGASPCLSVRWTYESIAMQAGMSGLGSRNGLPLTTSVDDQQQKLLLFWSLIIQAS